LGKIVVDLEFGFRGDIVEPRFQANAAPAA
jgi:hypothetical protein